MGSAEERWWSISGRPVIDALGHFRGFIGTGTDLTEQRRSEAEVNKLARFDPLTGLANRSEIGNVLDKSLQGKPGEARSTALMLVDLDRFKSVNDLYGHPTGDELLKQVTARFGQVIGAQGQIGRLGGDEFKVVLPGLSDRTALSAIARSMIQTAARPFIINAATINIGASIGVAIAPDDGVTSEELVRHADMALYAAKDAGRGVHRFFEQEMHSVAAARHVLETDMREALAQGEFRLVYQPIVSLGRNCIVGFEALIRWQHPTRGPVSPGEFIPIAEECGLIEQIGEWALREAAREASSWAVDARVAVNVSTIQFTNPAFPAVVASVLAQSGILPNRLELEITESVFVSDDEATDQQFAALKRLGIRLALDDFGTGYSSLGYLKRAPFDKIKIDQSFVRGASLGHNKNAAIIKAIVSLADTMAMETTAEGVETQDEIEFMRGLGCSHIQGFVYGKPLEASDLRQRLGARGDEAIAVGHKAMREPRVRVLRRARMSINGGIRPAIIRNLSSQGAMVEAEYWVPPGTEVMIDITDAMTVTARVSWADDGKIGLKFNERVNLAEVIPQASKFGRAG
jgi:diguanylate cyclase (GGDEF)-like protein